MTKPAQIPMRYSTRGGARVGAGRKKRRQGTAHARRPALSGREPVHVTLRVLDHVWNLRTRRCFAILLSAFVAGCRRFGVRVVGLSVQGDHLHLLLEAISAEALTRGMRGLAVRMAKGLNRLMGRKGAVFSERFHAHVLRTPREVRAAMAYISGNTAKHARQNGRILPAGHRDPFTVGWFGPRVLLPEGTEGMVAEPETWLLRWSWKVGDTPAPARRASRRGRAAGPREATALALPLEVVAVSGAILPRAANDTPAGDGHDGDARREATLRAVA